MEVLDEAFKGIQGTLDHRGGGTLGGGLPPSISLEGVGVSSISPVVVCCGFPPPLPPTAEAASLSPAKREATREARKRGRGGQENQTSPRSLVRSLVAENSVLTADFLPLGLWGRFDAVS